MDILPSLTEKKVRSVFLTVCAYEDDKKYIPLKNVMFAVTNK